MQLHTIMNSSPYFIVGTKLSGRNTSFDLLHTYTLPMVDNNEKDIHPMRWDVSSPRYVNFILAINTTGTIQIYYNFYGRCHSFLCRKSSITRRFPSEVSLFGLQLWTFRTNKLLLFICKHEFRYWSSYKPLFRLFYYLQLHLDSYVYSCLFTFLKTQHRHFVCYCVTHK